MSARKMRSSISISGVFWRTLFWDIIWPIMHCNLLILCWCWIPSNGRLCTILSIIHTFDTNQNRLILNLKIPSKWMRRRSIDCSKRSSSMSGNRGRKKSRRAKGKKSRSTSNQRKGSKMPTKPMRLPTTTTKTSRVTMRWIEIGPNINTSISTKHTQWWIHILLLHIIPIIVLRAMSTTPISMNSRTTVPIRSTTGTWTITTTTTTHRCTRWEATAMRIILKTIHQIMKIIKVITNTARRIATMDIIKTTRDIKRSIGEEEGEEEDVDAVHPIGLTAAAGIITSDRERMVIEIITHPLHRHTVIPALTESDRARGPDLGQTRSGRGPPQYLLERDPATKHALTRNHPLTLVRDKEIRRCEFTRDHGHGTDRGLAMNRDEFARTDHPATHENISPSSLTSLFMLHCHVTILCILQPLIHLIVLSYQSLYTVTKL